MLTNKLLLLAVMAGLPIGAGILALGGCSTQADPHAQAAPTVVYVSAPTEYDGVYVGGTVDTGVCRDTFRDYALVVEHGDARLLYSMRNGFQINGKVTQQGAITMTGTTSSGLIKFVGQIDGKTLRGTSIGIGVGATCETSWSFVRKDQ